MVNLSTWFRLEPQPRNESMQGMLEARLYDPLWTLGRQWQLGEFEGEDGGSPVEVTVKHESRPLQVKTKDLTCPLETWVEREPMITNAERMSSLMSAQIGLYFLEMLKDSGLGTWCTKVTDAYPFNDNIQGSPKAKRLESLFSRGALNGSALFSAVQAGNLNTDLADITDIAEKWVKWCQSLYSEPAVPEHTNPTEHADAWVKDRLEYAFSISAGDQKLVAEEYDNGNLDWYCFDIEDTKSTWESTINSSAIPTPLSFSGMPKLRYWELEDKNVNFPAVATDGSDLLRMIFVDFTMNYGNDWFMIPLKLKSGTITHIKKLIVKDSFGRSSEVKQRLESDWFKLSAHTNKKSSGLFLAPTLPVGLESKPIETVEFIKDEMANMAWAIEVKVEDKTGLNLERGSYNEDTNTYPQQDAQLPVYRLATPIPKYWTPMLLKTVNSERKLHLLDSTREGKILQGVEQVFEEEIIREGVTVSRTHQYVRWSDGTTHVWTGRKKKIGSRERSSGVQFDQIILNSK